MPSSAHRAPGGKPQRSESDRPHGSPAPALAPDARSPGSEAVATEPRPPRVHVHRTRRGAGYRALPVACGVLVAFVLAAVALWIGAENLKAAETDRRNDRADLVVSSAQTVANNQNLRSTEAMVLLSSRELNPFAPEVTRQFADHLKVQTGSDAIALTALLSPTGQTLSTYPTGKSIDAGPFWPFFEQARSGRAVLTDTFRYEGDIAAATLIPLGGDTPWAIVVQVERATGSPWQVLQREIGSLEDDTGGLVIVDRTGVVLSSWDDRQAGAQLYTPDEVAALPSDHAAVRVRHLPAGETIDIATRLPNGYAVAFSQPTDRLYRDLREMQQQRTRTLLMVLAGTLLALVVFHLARERTARRSEARFRAILHHNRDVVVVCDRAGVVRFASPAVERLLGMPVEAWQDKALTGLCHPDDACRVRSLVTQPGGAPELNVRLTTADGEHRWFDVEAADRSDLRELRGVLLTFHEVGRRKELQDELVFLAHHDRLTALANRSRFTQHIESFLADGRPRRQFALLYLDLDRFKPVNDTLGHEAGDRVLRVISDRLSEAAGPEGLVCRFGGDEFAIALDGADERAAVTVAQWVLDAIRAPIFVGRSPTFLDASIGIVSVDTGHTIHNAEELTRHADQAMYEAKAAGRGRIRVVRPPVVGIEGHRAAVDGRRPWALRRRGGPEEDGNGDRAAYPIVVSLDGDGDGRAGDGAPPDGAHAERGARNRVPVTAPVVLSAVVVLTIAFVGRAQSTSALRTAETQRLANKTTEAVYAAAHYARLYDPSRMGWIGDTVDWHLTGDDHDALYVAAFQQSDLAGPDGGVAALMERDGDVLTSSPRGARPNIELDGPVWQRVLNGEASGAMHVADPDAVRNYLFLPVMRNGRTAAVLALGGSSRGGIIQHLFEVTGSVGSDTGGWSMLDRDGVVMSSWKPDLIGTRLAEGSFLRNLSQGQSRSGTTVAGDVLTVAQLFQFADGYRFYLAFSMPPDEFYRDLRVGQTQRDAALLLLVLGSVAGLALVNHGRVLEMRRREQRFDALLQHAHDVTVVLDSRRRVSFVTSAVQRLLGQRPEDWMGTELLSHVHPEDRERVAASVFTARPAGSASVEDVRIRTATGDHRWFDVHALDLSDDGHVAGTLVVCHEVSRRKDLEDELTHLARHDPLTGLLNRAALTDHLQSMRTSPTKPFAVLFVDLDLFKPVNDTLGHEVGDEVLRIVANRLEVAIRSGSQRGSDVLCRWGGDEFAMVLHDVDETRARQVADRVLDAASQPIAVAGTVIELGATIGVALSRTLQADPDVALREADLAMYRAKEEGRGRYAFFEMAN